MWTYLEIKVPTPPILRSPDRVVTFDFTGGGGQYYRVFVARARRPRGVKKWYFGSKLGRTTIKFVFSDPEIGGNVFFDFIFTIGNPPPPSR